MERIDPRAAASHLSKTPCEPGRSANLGQEDSRQKERMILKLMSSFPPQQDAALRIEAYIEALSGVPWRWVSKGLARLVKTPQRASSGARVFCPSVPEVLEAVAAVIREARTKANGGVPLDYSVHGGHNLNVIGELSFVRRETQIAIEAGFVYEGARALPKTTSAPSD